MKISDIISTEYEDFNKLSETKRTEMLKKALNVTKSRITRAQNAYRKIGGYENTHYAPLFAERNGQYIEIHGTGQRIYAGGVLEDKFDQWAQLKVLKRVLAAKTSTLKGARSVQATRKANLENATGLKVSYDEVAAIYNLAENDMDRYSYLKNYERWRIAIKAVRQHGANASHEEVDRIVNSYQSHKEALDRAEEHEMKMKYSAIYRNFVEKTYASMGKEEADKYFGVNGVENPDEW